MHRDASPGAWSEVRPGRGLVPNPSLRVPCRPRSPCLSVVVRRADGDGYYHGDGWWHVCATCVCHLSVCLPGLVVSFLIHQIVNTKDAADDHHPHGGTVHPASAHRSTSGSSSRIPVPSAAALLPCPGLAARPSWSPDGGPSRSLFPRNLRDPAGRSFRRLAGPHLNPNPKRQPRFGAGLSSGVSGVWCLVSVFLRSGTGKCEKSHESA